MADSQLSTTEETAHAAATEAAAAPAPAATTSSSLLDGFEEEEGDTQTLLTATTKPAATSQISMDFDEEEDEDDEATKLLKKEKARKLVQQEGDDDDEVDEGGDKSDKKKKKKKKEKKEKKKRKHREEEEASEAEEDEEEEEGEAGFYDMMEDEVAMGEEERRLNHEYEDEDNEDGVDLITSLSLPALNPEQQVPATMQCYSMHLPSFLSIAAPRFDSSKLSSTEQEFVVRWRQQGDKMESNTSIVEYTDGTMDLFVGDTCVANLKLSSTSNEYVFVRNNSVDEDDQSNYHLCLSKLHALTGSAMLIASDQLNVSQVMSRHKKQKAKMVEKLTELDPELEQDLRSKRVDQAHRSNVKSRNRQSHALANKKKQKDDFTAGFLEQGNKKRQKRARSSDEEEEEAFIDSSSDDSSSDDDDDDE